MKQKLSSLVEGTQEPEFVWPRHLTHEVKPEYPDFLVEGSSEEVVEWLEEKITKPGQYVKRAFIGKDANLLMENYLKRLQKEGLDIGKGEALYGYKMPLADKHGIRDLVIFRRRE